MHKKHSNRCNPSYSPSMNIYWLCLTLSFNFIKCNKKTTTILNAGR